MSNIEIFDDEQFSELVTEKLVKVLNERDSSQPFHLFLSGGSTPKPIYGGLAQSDLDWTNVHFWWGDERFVPHDHADSNFRMVREQLLDVIKVPPTQVHPWPILSTPELSAETYEREFQHFFLKNREPLSFQLLGMGDDGHTASLFPESRALQETVRHCIENYVDSKDSVRLTLTYPALAMSERIVFVLRGAGKAQTLKEVLEEKRHPASKVEGKSQPEFWIDRSASAKL